MLGRKGLACFVIGSGQPQGKCGFAVSTAMDTGDSSHDCPSALLQAAVVWKELGSHVLPGPPHVRMCIPWGKVSWLLSYFQCVLVLQKSAEPPTVLTPK